MEVKTEPLDSEMCEKCEKLQKENAKMEKEMAEVRKENSKLKEEMAELRKENAKLKAQNQREDLESQQSQMSMTMDNSVFIFHLLILIAFYSKITHLMRQQRKRHKMMNLLPKQCWLMFNWIINNNYRFPINRETFEMEKKLKIMEFVPYEVKDGEE
jgi:predicted RNase H-like nuclease (RuvC/YqgF family)